ncbi:MAG: efflux RND transporter periplasmic adaptor subunit [Planctomycetota bacterium]
MKPTTHLPWVALILAMVLLCAGCERNENKYVPSPPPEVTVSQPVEKDVTNYAEFTGNTVAVATVDLRARVKGFLRSVNFTVSSNVKKGDLLFVIEPEPYEAQVNQAKGDLAAKEAQHKAAIGELAIKEEMYAKNAASKLDVISATDKRDTAAAQIEVASASLESAQINLGYTHIYSPINGCINRNLVDAGNLVGAGEDTLLATVVQNDPMYAYFNIGERDLLEHMVARKTADRKGKPPVYLGLATEDGCPHAGEIDFIDNRLDPNTGTIQARGVFPNSDGALIPGLFVRVRVPGDKERGLLVPDIALGADQEGKFLLVVNDKNIVERRTVKVGPVFDGMRLIREGLKPGEWVVVNGMLRARPGSEVKPQRQPLGAPAPAPAAGK